MHKIHSKKCSMLKALALFAVCCTLTLLQLPTHEAAADEVSSEVPSYVEIPDEGEYTIGDDKEAVEQNGELTLGTDFYIRIENPNTTEQPSAVAEYLPQAGEVSGSLPQTGDYGVDKTTLLKLTLLFGAGYLLCCYLEDRPKKRQSE